LILCVISGRCGLTARTIPNAAVAGKTCGVSRTVLAGSGRPPAILAGSGQDGTGPHGALSPYGKWLP
jgi:hypothetical protein